MPIRRECTLLEDLIPDMRGPQRDGKTRALLISYWPPARVTCRPRADELGDKLTAESKSHLERIGLGAARMGELIDALVRLWRLSRAELVNEHVDLSVLARSASTPSTACRSSSIEARGRGRRARGGALGFQYDCSTAHSEHQLATLASQSGRARSSSIRPRVPGGFISRMFARQASAQPVVCLVTLACETGLAIIGSRPASRPRQNVQ